MEDVLFHLFKWGSHEKLGFYEFKTGFNQNKQSVSTIQFIYK